MSETVRVAVDAMGGDNAPGEIVKGAVQAVQAEKDIKVFLVGRQDAVNAELAKYTYDKEKIEVVHAEEVIEMAEPPVNAIRKKKQSSLVIGMNMIKHQEADAIVTAGSTGATLVGGQVLVGRIKGIERPPLGTFSSDGKGSFTSDRLWSECGCTSVTSGAICPDWIYLYGEHCRNQESESGDPEYRSRRGKGQSAGKGDVSIAERMSWYQFYRKY